MWRSRSSWSWNWTSVVFCDSTGVVIVIEELRQSMRRFFFGAPRKKEVSRTLCFRHRLIFTKYYRGVVTNMTTVDRVSKYSVKTRRVIRYLLIAQKIFSRFVRLVISKRCSSVWVSSYLKCSDTPDVSSGRRWRENNRLRVKIFPFHHVFPFF